MSFIFSSFAKVLIALSLAVASISAWSAELPLPANAHYTSKNPSAGWRCNWGYVRASNACEKIAIPDHGYLDPLGGLRWKCHRGYRAEASSCVAIEVPKNGYLTNRRHGKLWSCERGYKAVDDQCLAVVVPENGFLIDSPSLAAELATEIESLMSFEDSWEVTRDAAGNLRWTSAEGVVTRQPARGFLQRISDFFLRLLPIESQL